ncbi:hypothetical protein [Microcoleus sp. B7-D4]|uniref:hypothetical protein n=1 Tax=Microcoleus sp. B7-D4 TaxID=2818696 RepID=UPI002FD3703C
MRLLTLRQESVDFYGELGKIFLLRPQAREFEVISTGELKKTELNAPQLKCLMHYKLAAVPDIEFAWKCIGFHSWPVNCHTLKIYAPTGGARQSILDFRF